MDYIVLPIEVSLGGVFVPPLFLASVLGVVLALITTRVLQRLDWSRFVWHLPLFFLALVVIYSGIVGIFVIPT